MSYCAMRISTPKAPCPNTVSRVHTHDMRVDLGKRLDASSRGEDSRKIGLPQPEDRPEDR